MPQNVPTAITSATWTKGTEVGSTPTTWITREKREKLRRVRREWSDGLEEIRVPERAQGDLVGPLGHDRVNGRELRQREALLLEAGEGCHQSRASEVPGGQPHVHQQCRMVRSLA